MRVHHLNCGTMCPYGAGLIVFPGDEPRGMVCHCLLIETDDGLVLVDTGFGTGDIADPGQLGFGFAMAMRAPLKPEETALEQIQAMGFKRSDVRHLIPTHLDLDHAGGLGDFPEARVHIFTKELEAALARSTIHEQRRYRPAHFAHGPRWVKHEVRGERWFGFECVRELEGLPPEILLVPTVGHTRGHVAVAVDDGKGFMLHAGDAYFHRAEMDATHPRCPIGLRVFQRTMAMDDLTRVRNRERLRILARDQPVRVFSAHDPVELDRMRAG